MHFYSILSLQKQHSLPRDYNICMCVCVCVCVELERDHPSLYSNLATFLIRMKTKGLVISKEAACEQSKKKYFYPQKPGAQTLKKKNCSQSSFREVLKVLKGVFILFFVFIPWRYPTTPPVYSASENFLQQFSLYPLYLFPIPTSAPLWYSSSFNSS